MQIKKRFVVLFLILLFLVFMTLWKKQIIFNVFKKEFTNFPHLTNATCNPDLWSHVYSPNRLYKINDCIKVTGVVRWTENEEDGDVHILIRLDDKYKDEINIFNKIFMGGNLVTEVVCHGESKDKEIIEACGNYKSNLKIPNREDRVEITGPFVIDTSYGWSEIHPIDSLTILNSNSK